MFIDGYNNWSNVHEISRVRFFVGKLVFQLYKLKLYVILFFFLLSQILESLI